MHTFPGCFDHEEEAAKAYDKMMLWCEIHNSTGVKGGITNFDSSVYEEELPWLQQCSQVMTFAWCMKMDLSKDHMTR